MTQYIAWISLENRSFACGELQLLLDARISTPPPAETFHEAPENHIIFFETDADESLFERLAYTKNVARVIDSTPLSKPKEKFDFKKEDASVSSYRVNFFNSMHDIDEQTAKTIFASVFRSVDKPKINLKTPQATFYAFIDYGKKTNQKTLWIAREIWHNDYAYEKRMPHLRQRRHPASMPPKLMRGMINLTGLTAKKKEIICDPFCGTAGILIEAMHCGFHVVGSDIELKMVNGAKINIKNEIVAIPKFAKLCDPIKNITKESALAMKTKADAMVMDVPYGKNTKKVHNPDLYLDFLNHVAKSKLTTRIVICLPDFADGKSIIEKTSWRILGSYALKVHNGLTREVFVLEV